MALANGLLHTTIIRPGRKTSPQQKPLASVFLCYLILFCQSVWFLYSLPVESLQCESNNRVKKPYWEWGWVKKPIFNLLLLSVTFTPAPAEGAQDQRPREPPGHHILSWKSSYICCFWEIWVSAIVVGSHRTNHHVVTQDLLTPQADLWIWCLGGGKEKPLCVITTCWEQEAGRTRARILRPKLHTDRSVFI